MQELARIAFVAEPRAEAALEVHVNFGIFAGREVTAAEIDALAHALLPEVRAVSIVSEERHEIDREVEVSVHQVRIEIGAGAAPEGSDLEALGKRLATIAERWAEGCVSERHAELSDG